MIKSFFKDIIAIIFRPSETWAEIEKNGFEKPVYLTYVLPLILTSIITTIIGLLWGQNTDLQSIIKATFVCFVSYYAGYFISVLIIKLLINKFYTGSPEWHRILYFTAFSSTLMYILNAIVQLIPVEDMFFLKIFNIYTFYIVSQGAFILKLKEEEQTSVILISTIIILLCPLAIEKLMSILMPGMKF